MEQSPVRQLHPIDYLKIIFRRKWLLILPIVVGIVGGLIAGNVMPKIYESSALVLVEEGKVINPLIQGIAVSTSVAQRLSMLREQILGWDRVMQLIKNLGLDKNVKNQYEFEMLVRMLRRNIKVNLKGQNLIMISYEGKEAAEVQKIVQTILDIFISENVRQQGKEAENAIDFINDQVALYQKKLKETEVASMQDELKKLMVDSTDKHPMVLELKRKIEAAKNEIKDGNYYTSASTTADADTQTKALKDELKQLRDEFTTQTLESTDTGSNRTKVASPSSEKLYKLLLLDKLDKTEARNQGVTQKLYDDLLGRLETAKMTQRLEASREGTKYTILDPPRLPLKPSKPNKAMLLLLGIFVGGCIGMGFVFLSELFDHSFLGVDEAKRFLELPIFGAVSKIITEDDIKIQKLRNARVAALSVVTGIVLLIAIIFNVFLGG